MSEVKKCEDCARSAISKPRNRSSIFQARVCSLSGKKVKFFAAEKCQKFKPKLKLGEPRWKHLIVEAVWDHWREIQPLFPFASPKQLPDTLAAIIRCVRLGTCDMCGSRHTRENEVTRYQCCAIRSEEEEYVPNLCVDCHQHLQEARPHATVSV